MKLGIILLLISSMAVASFSEAERVISQRMDYGVKLKRLIKELVDEELYFSAIPWVKEYITRSSYKYDQSFEKDFSKILKVVGTKQFETLPVRYLRRSKLNTIKYILGKKLIKINRLSSAIEYLESVNPNHSIYPYAQNALATAYSLKGEQNKAILAYNQCINNTQSYENALENRQAKINRDFCTLGIARSMFAAKSYKKAELKFLDIPKSSPIWPSILFEEAWNSYYLKNYNRTLGKLVTYNAPIFKKFFNPEFEVLKALTYLKLCLYQDAKDVSDRFYKVYLQRTRRLRVFLKSKGKDYNYYYKLYSSFGGKKITGSSLLDSLLASLNTDGAMLGLKEKLSKMTKEYEELKSRRRSRLQKALVNNLKEVIRSHRRIIGAYVRARLVEKYAELYRAFEGMSYIKLEVLAQKKAKLYDFKARKKKKRGDIKYLERNDKQYFWDFNGEFWADELGDYVFALKSEC